MANMFDGIQYRELKVNFTSWQDDNYTAWQDCGDLTNFATGTQFRVKPVFDYEVTITTNDSLAVKTDIRTTSKDKAMSRVATLVEEGKRVRIDKKERATAGVSTLLSERGAQFKVLGSNKWVHPNYLSTAGQGSPIQFRLRPDTYFEVLVASPASPMSAQISSTLTFDDVEDVVNYISRQLRTSENNFSIKKRAYV